MINGRLRQALEVGDRFKNPNVCGGLWTVYAIFDEEHVIMTSTNVAGKPTAGLFESDHILKRWKRQPKYTERTLAAIKAFLIKDPAGVFT